MSDRAVPPGASDMLRVATYGRISGHEDQIKADRKGIKVLSLDVQAEQTQAFVRKNRGVVTRTLSDVKSGWCLTRTDYLTLLELGRLREIDAVCLFRLDRFGRDNGEAIARCDDLERAGVQIWSVIEGVGIPKFIRDIHFTVAANESAMAAQRGAPVTRKLAELGLWVVRAPYGYRTNPQRPGYIVVDEYEKWVIQTLFARAADNDTAYNLTLWLNSLVDPAEPHTWSPRARSGEKGRSMYWEPSTVRHILCNEAYAGWVCYDRRSNSRRRNVPRGQKPAEVHVHAKGLHEALVDQDTFDRVQQRASRQPYLLSRSPTRAAAGRRFALAGLVHCAECGRSMKGTWTHLERGHGRRDFLYRCSMPRHATIYGPRLHSAVLDQLERLCLDEGIISAARRRLEEDRGEAGSDPRPGLRVEREQAIQRRVTLGYKYADNHLTDEQYAEMVGRVEADLARIEGQMAEYVPTVAPRALLAQAEQELTRLRSVRPVLADALASADAADLEDAAIFFGATFEKIVIARGIEPQIIWQDWANLLLAPEGSALAQA